MTEHDTPTIPAPRVVIVGGGFGGLSAARSLADDPVHVTLIDRWNHHLFQPLLYQVATAALSPADIASPLRAILRAQRNADVLLGEVTAVDVGARAVLLADGTRVPYDYLVLAAGAGSTYFGHDEWRAHAPGLKSIADALDIRRRVFLALELADRATDPAARARYLTFVVVGGGPTGVEMAGAIAEIARETVAKEYRTFDPAHAKIYLLDGGSRLLASFPERLARRAERDLKSLGVIVRTKTHVTGVEAGAVLLADERIETETVVWAAGVAPSPLGRTLGVPLDHAGRVRVGPDLAVSGHPEIFVIGDLAAREGRDGKLLPGLAPVAMQEGETAARNLVRRVRYEPPEIFRYRDRGTMATIGRNRAIADIKGIHLTGISAWLAWALVHIALLINFRNRIVVMIEWIWAYFTHQRPARLVVATDREPEDAGEAAARGEIGARRV